MRNTTSLTVFKSQAAEAALAFCREVKGWEEVYGPYPNNPKAFCGGKDGEYQIFDPTDLNAVMAASEAFHQGRFLTLSIVNSGMGWFVELENTHFGVHAKVDADDLCPALMAACVEASRQLKGVV